MSIRRVSITGSSGAYGRGVIRELRERFPGVRIQGLDLTPATEDLPDEFICGDIQSDSLRGHLGAFAPDTVIHLAFIVRPIHDEREMHRINVGGAENVLNAVRAVQPRRLLVSSSATAYGAWPDNPLPLPADWEPRAPTEFRYAHDKFLVERLLARFAAEQPGMAVSWTRPCIICGPGVSSYLTKMITRCPLVILPGGNDTELQLVHLDDVAAATATILANQGQGAYNVAPSDWITLRDIARLTGRRCLKLPLRLLQALTFLHWNLRLPSFSLPPGFWDFMRYPWVVSPRRLANEFGFQCRHSSQENLELLLDQAGKLILPLTTPRQPMRKAS